MSTRTWTVTTELTGPTRKIDVRLYDTLGGMRRAAMRFAKKVGEKVEDGHYNNGLAVVHGFTRTRVDASGQGTNLPECAVVRLVRGYLQPEIVAHEVAHLAQHLYRIDFLSDDGSQRAIDHIDSGNEAFAYLYGGLFATIWEMLEDER